MPGAGLFSERPDIAGLGNVAGRSVDRDGRRVKDYLPLDLFSGAGGFFLGLSKARASFLGVAPFSSFSRLAGLAIEDSLFPIDFSDPRRYPGK